MHRLAIRHMKQLGLALDNFFSLRYTGPLIASNKYALAIRESTNDGWHGPRSQNLLGSKSQNRCTTDMMSRCN